MISDEELVALGLIKSERIYVSADLLKRMATELLAYREAERANLQCWLAEDPETGCFDEYGMAEDIAGNLQGDTEATHEILCSVRIQNRYMRVWLTGEDDPEVHFEWVGKP